MSSALRQPRSGAVMLESSLQREIRRALTAAGVESCAAFVLVELGDTGLRASVVDAATGGSIVEHGNGRLCPHMLDLTLADHLVRIGRVTRPESTEWAAELIGLMPQVRERLAAVDGAFAMGTEHVAMFRMSRTDCVTALSRELTDAASIITRTVDEAPVDVDAVVVMPDHESWPGLVGELAERLELPVVALDGEGDDPDGGRHTVGAAEIESAPVPDPEPEPAEDEQSEPEEIAAEPVVVEQSDPEPTTRPIPVTRTAEPLAYAVEQGGAGIPTATPEVSPGPAVAQPDAPGVSDHRVRDITTTGDHDVLRDHGDEVSVTGAGPRAYAPPGGASGRAEGPGGRRRLAVGAVAVGGAVALGGVILAVPWLHGSDGTRSAPSAVGFTSPTTAPTASAAVPTTGAPTTPAPTTTPGAQAPIDTRPAQGPAVQYTAPPPPQQPSYVSPGRPRGGGLPLPVIPRRRTIPNPIPGLPPIVLP
ncbi:hypothetical protein [Williamsia serinedens]|uniref:Uncharacterized protein n=1 Tax=Williamsia serinedens TaxID=391736 RepID=A0ABT1H2R9_9NOCA|nr:hypothetical protein [Williamsia serinedens]MCP2161533.1 hypothetical protein [Williamsia serinedens]